MENTSRFSVAVCGGGIGGVALAMTIGKYSDIPVDVYEAGPEIATNGAGVGLWRRAWQVMHQLELEDAVIAKAIQPPKESGGLGLIFRKSDEPEGGYDLFEQFLPYGAISMHRADVLRIFETRLPPSCKLHTSKRLTHYTTPPSGTPVTLHFADGTSATADVLIGADGVRSPTRTSLFEMWAKEHLSDGTTPPPRVEPIFGGSLVYRCLISIDLLKTLNPEHRAIHSRIIYCGKDKHIVSYPLQGGLINFLAFSSAPGVEHAFSADNWVVDISGDEIIALFEEWEPDVRTLVQCVRQAKRWAVHIVEPLPTFVHQNVALIGDAAHAMPTHMAAGAGQAIEDAYLLGRILTHPSLSPSFSLSSPTPSPTLIPTALKIYDQIRRPFVAHIAAESRVVGLLYEFNAPGLSYDGSGAGVSEGNGKGKGVGKKGDMEELKRVLEEKWSWHGVGEGGPDDNWEEARGVLERLGVGVGGLTFFLLDGGLWVFWICGWLGEACMISGRSVSDTRCLSLSLFLPSFLQGVREVF
ncbi:Salicylate hydroxylase [Hypsizygus marmoreus]|uniref:Salicylate hydroxylase n=1 Tax=Hypsizygus marmoreus TaxID=39966 RepID=A0A369JZQ6_HYPMA|nr:Salicylate hydroxylase [Hypsizygus marmoreus]